MNAYEKIAFEYMSSSERCNMVLGKVLELIEVARLLTDSDMEALISFKDTMLKEMECDSQSTDVVPREAYEQVAWERDVAIKQLWDDYGVRLGQKKADAKLARTAWNRRAGEGADHGE